MCSRDNLLSLTQGYLSSFLHRKLSAFSQKKGKDIFMNNYYLYIAISDSAPLPRLIIGTASPYWQIFVLSMLKII